MYLAQTVESFGQGNQSWIAGPHGTDANVSVQLDTSAFTPNVHYPKGFFPSGLPIAKILTGAGAGKWGPYAGGASEVQTVTITGTPTGGTFTLSYSGETTAAIAYNATAAQVRSALEALSNVNVGDVTVTGGPGPGTAYTVTFGGRYAGQNVAQMTASGASLTGGTSPAVTVATSTPGGSAASDGTETLYGFLYQDVKVPPNTSIDPAGAAFVHGGVVEANLPIAIDEGAKSSVRGRIWFV